MMDTSMKAQGKVFAPRELKERLTQETDGLHPRKLMGQ